MNNSRLACLARNAAKATRAAQRKPRLMPLPQPLMPKSSKWVSKSAEEIMNAAAPLKSAYRYDQEWKKFEEFRGNSDEPGEAEYLKYFDYLHEGKEFKASTLWKMYGILNSNHQRKYGRRLQYWPRLKKLLNRYNQGYVRKTASIFTRDEVKQALLLDYSTAKWVIIYFTKYLVTHLHTYVLCTLHLTGNVEGRHRNCILRRPSWNRGSLNQPQKCEGR